MLVVTDKIIAFKKNGELVIFDSRTEFIATDIKKEGISLLFASPSDLYRDVLELEEVEEAVTKEDDWRVSPQWKEEADFSSIEELQVEQAADEEADEKDFEKQVKEAVEEGEFSEATIRRIREREAERQRKILGDVRR